MPRRRGRWLLMALTAAYAVFPSPNLDAADKPAIRLVPGAGGKATIIEVTGLPAEQLERLSKAEEAAAVLKVYVVDEGAASDLPAMLGAYQVEGGALRFHPKYPLRPGIRYRALLRLANGGSPPETISQDIAIPESPRGRPAKVTAVYPSAAVLPENQLRFYIHFSAPMSRREAYDHIRLLNRDGKPIEDGFLEIGEELWDPNSRRLTLLIDPGRIKRGLKPREDLGPVLEAGGEYTLVIDKGWEDASGRPLASSFEKKFKAGPPVESAIDPATWKLELPHAGSRERLVVRFPAPLDRALLERTFSVANTAGKQLRGDVVVGDEERRWEFRPEKPWQTSEYRLVVDTVLEDLAGNRIGKPFEVDEATPVERRVETKVFQLPFTPGEPTVPAAAESSLPTARDLVRQLAFDGREDTFYSSAKNPVGDDHFTLVFDKPVRLKSVAVTTGRPDGAELLAAGELQVSADGKQFEKVAGFSGGLARSDGMRQTIRAVRIQPAGDVQHPLTIREIAIDSHPPVAVFRYPVEFALDFADAPQMQEWAENTARICERAYGMINEELASDGYRPRRLVRMALKKDYGGVAATSGGNIVGSVKFFTEHPDDVGAMVHETAHVVQDYRGRGNPGWLVEGVADYVRFFQFEPGKIGRISPERSHYNGSYRVTAAFLAFLVKEYDSGIVHKLNEAMRKGEYREELFEELTGKTLEELDNVWRASLRR